MYTNKDIENIDKQIEELYAKRAELEAIEAEKEKEQKRKAKEDKDKELIAIKNAITAFNEKHGENICLAFNENRKTNDGIDRLFFPWCW